MLEESEVGRPPLMVPTHSIVLAALRLCASGTAFGQEPPPVIAPPGVETCPQPQPTVSTLVVIPAPYPLAPLGSRDVWKNFSVDASGRFRPRVVMAPYESSYYYFNGAPYRYQ